MPRFVILDHDHPSPHFDLMLEVGGVLWTWRLSALPVPGQEQDALRLGDHRLVYLEYEGPVSGDRGRVVRRARGELGEVSLGNNSLTAQLRGESFHGQLVLIQIDGDRWRMRFEPTQR